MKIEYQQETDVLSEVRPREQPSWLRYAGESLAVFALAALFYVSLYGELQYHDVSRFVTQIEGGKYVWDIGHVFLQPATLLWHRYLGFGESAEKSQKHINTIATALALSIFDMLLLLLGIPPGRRVFAILLVMTSCSVITLAPTGHMKLLAFPFLNLAFLCAVIWEKNQVEEKPYRNRLLVLCGAFLALASAFLASCLAAAPFVAVAVALVCLKMGHGWKKSLQRSTIFAATCGFVFLVFVCIGYLEFAKQPLTLQGIAASVAEKDALRGVFLTRFSIVDRLGRLVFGTANNFLAAPVLGSVVRAWLSGQIPSLWPYRGALAGQLLPWLLTAGILASIYFQSIRTQLRRPTCIMPVAFLLGATSWVVYYNLNDPEHWFHLTVPTVFLFLMIFPSKWTRLVLPLWASATAVVNLMVIAIPVASYPLQKYEIQMRHMFTQRDLVVGFAAYPGRQYIGSFDLPGVPRLRLDQYFQRSGNEKAFWTSVEDSIGKTFAGGGRVFVFGVFDPHDWDAPWAILNAHGMTKQKMLTFFNRHYIVKPLGEIAEIRAWQLFPRSDASMNTANTDASENQEAPEFPGALWWCEPVASCSYGTVTVPPQEVAPLKHTAAVKAEFPAAFLARTR